jgi:L,D-transpeptidase YcbB
MRRPLAYMRFACVLVLVLAATCVAAQQGDKAASAIKRIVTEVRHPALKWPDFRFYDDEMRRFYEPLGYRPAWFEGGKLRKQVPEIIVALRGADDVGLNSADYDAAWLEEHWQANQAGRMRDDNELALFDTALSLNLFRYISDVHIGKINPKNVGFEVDIERKKYDLPAFVREAVEHDRLPQALAEAEPHLPMYGRLKLTLQRYRVLARDTTLSPVPEVKKVEPGKAYAGVSQLRARLIAFGDLPPDAPAGRAGVYEGEVVEAVKRFQDRHGLAPDGVLGHETFVQLNVPPTQRVRQIELALERMRWLPQPPPGPIVGINIPEFKLWAFEDDAGRLKTVFRMPVVVGKALNTRTPVFMDEMRYVVFSPYWNVPPSIARNEIIPALRKDPGYLGKHDMELVRSADAQPVGGVPDESTLAAIRRGELRVRQKPGPKNSLGRVKFIFPNNMNIYLHDTPAQALFKQRRRDFSHGCIRVGDPPKLARFVLQGLPEWNDERIEAAMAAGKESTVRLPKPIPVIIFYTTVIVEEDGTVRFLPDIYGHDKALDAALTAGYPYPP